MKIKKTFHWMTGTLLAGAFLLGTSAMAAEVQQAASTGDQTSSVYRAVGLGAAAAFAVAVSILGAGYAVGRIGSAAVGALAEKPELLPRTIIFVALAEGLAVLGFAIAMMLLQKI
jgi:V/A-type H+-transporting ATPase subunit K